jgi:hypothetical protein
LQQSNVAGPSHKSIRAMLNALRSPLNLPSERKLNITLRCFTGMPA